MASSLLLGVAWVVVGLETRLLPGLPSARGCVGVSLEFMKINDFNVNKELLNTLDSHCHFNGKRQNPCPVQSHATLIMHNVHYKAVGSFADGFPSECQPVHLSVIILSNQHESYSEGQTIHSIKQWVLDY